jgi:hypothetical protein
MGKMWFKLTYSLDNMFLARRRDAPVSVLLQADGNGEIVLWLRTLKDKRTLSYAVML